jgi:hypothetical protein
MGFGTVRKGAKNPLLPSPSQAKPRMVDFGKLPIFPQKDIARNHSIA